MRAQQYSQGKSCLVKKAVKFEERKTPRGAQHMVEKEMQMVQRKPGCKRETETLCCLDFNLVPVSSSPLNYRSLICAPVHLQADKVYLSWCQPWSLLAAGFFIVVSSLRMTKTFLINGRR